MLTYTFSTREKVLLAVLAVVALVVIWYKFVFMNIQDQTREVESQIAAVQDEMILYQTETAGLSNMKAQIEALEAQGYKANELPQYDNTQPLMAFLNSTLAGSRGFTVSFDDPTLGDDGLVHRTGTITYGCGSYDEARNIASNIAHGPYPCKVDSFAIADTSKKNGGGAPVSSSIQGAFQNTMVLTFFEKPTANMTNVSKEESGSSGQDLSKLSDWNK